MVLDQSLVKGMVGVRQNKLSPIKEDRGGVCFWGGATGLCLVNEKPARSLEGLYCRKGLALHMTYQVKSRFHIWLPDPCQE